MDAEEGRVVHRMRHPNKLAVVVAVQNVLVAACLLATLYVYWDVPKVSELLLTLSNWKYSWICFETIFCLRLRTCVY